LKTAKYILPLLCLLAVACRDVPTYDVVSAKGDTLKENMINANRIMAQSEEQQIAAYVARRGATATRLASGVHVMTTVAGTTTIDHEDTVALRYRVETLGGKEVYGWRDDTVVCGHLQPTRGLDAALRTLHRGATARVIVPSEQGYGVIGDGDRINTRTVLLYELEIDDVKKLK